MGGEGVWSNAGPGATTESHNWRQPLAPAAVQRIRIASLYCLTMSMVPEAADPFKPAASLLTDTSYCAGGTPKLIVAAPTSHLTSSLSGLAWDIASTAVPFLGLSHAAPLRAAAAETIMAAARLDPDGVWMLLYDVAFGAAPCTGSAGIGEPPAAVSSLGRGKCNPKGGSSPTLRPTWMALKQRGQRGQPGQPGMTDLGGSGSNSWPVNPSICNDCCQAAQQLLSRVEKSAAKAPWWSQAAIVAPDWQYDGEIHG